VHVPKCRDDAKVVMSMSAEKRGRRGVVRKRSVGSQLMLMFSKEGYAGDLAHSSAAANERRMERRESIVQIIFKAGVHNT
jgi:hypothetical protein